MEAQRATDNIQQKASDCLGTENEKPYTMGDRIKDMNETFALIREAFTMIEKLQALKNVPKYPMGGIVTKPKYDIFLNGAYVDTTEFIINDNPKKD